MRIVTFATAVLLAGAAALAQDSADPRVLESMPDAQGNPPAPAVPQAKIPPPQSGGRFAFNPVAGGLLRLDRETGQVAFCSAHAVGWACQAVPEDRAALEKEIARLQDEIARLKAQIAALREPPPPPRPPADLTPPGGQGEGAKRLREDIARARAVIENAWQRLIEMMANFQKDVLHKG